MKNVMRGNRPNVKSVSWEICPIPRFDRSSLGDFFSKYKTTSKITEKTELGIKVTGTLSQTSNIKRAAPKMRIVGYRILLAIY